MEDKIRQLDLQFDLLLAEGVECLEKQKDLALQISQQEQLFMEKIKALNTFRKTHKQQVPQHIYSNWLTQLAQILNPK